MPLKLIPKYTPYPYHVIPCYLFPDPYPIINDNVIYGQPLTKCESLFTSVVIVVPNLGDCGNLDLDNLEEFDQETFKEVEGKTIVPNKVKNMDDTVYNT